MRWRGRGGSLPWPSPRPRPSRTWSQVGHCAQYHVHVESVAVVSLLVTCMLEPQRYMYVYSTYTSLNNDFEAQCCSKRHPYLTHNSRTTNIQGKTLQLYHFNFVHVQCTSTSVNKPLLVTTKAVLHVLLSCCGFTFWCCVLVSKNLI